MRPFVRDKEPGILHGNWEEWGRQWEQRRVTTDDPKFNWRQHENQKVYDVLMLALRQQTQDHCSFCDYFPVCPPSDETIEHFLPKAEYPLEAYRWTNLYYCCRCCQRKTGKFSADVLQPDADDYDFDRYFRWDFTRGLLEVNPLGTAPDQERARKTIEYFRLNEDHPRARLKEQRFFRSTPDDPIDSFGYRHFVKPPEDSEPAV